MDYYNYTSYFKSLIGQLDDVLDNQSSGYGQGTELLTEVRALHTDMNTQLDTINQTLTGGIRTLSIILVLSCIIKVMFK